MMMKRFPLYAMLMALAVLQAVGAEIRGIITDPNGSPVPQAMIILNYNDSATLILESDAKGAFRCAADPSDTLYIEVQAVGYEPLSVTAEGSAEALNLSLQPAGKTVDLDEVVVEADRSGVMERMANGKRFFLSKRAREMNDPFMALQEIPVLASDPFNSTVTTVSGDAPLVLVDGLEVNSGIRPILPADIESVEVIDVVPARYLARGVKSILNIRLRKHRPPYIWTELATRHEIPLHTGMGVAYFEVGNEKVSLYGRASANYTWHDDSDGREERSNTGYNQQYQWNTRNDSHRYLGELLLKFVPSATDYFAIQGEWNHTPKRSATEALGSYEEVEAAAPADMLPYSSTALSGDTSTIVTSSAFYRHVFSPTADFQVTANYNFNRNLLATSGAEFFGDTEVATSSDFHSTRHSGNVNLNFNKVFGGIYALQAGSTTSLVNDRISRSPFPLFRHRNYNEYLYASFSGQVANLYYMVSAGLDATWLTAGDVSGSYFFPRTSASATWAIDAVNSLQLQYSSSTTSPAPLMLNPYNTSTNPLVEVRGNPDLRPQDEYGTAIAYTFYRNGLYLQPTFGGSFVENMLVPAGYTDSRGVYTSTYLNMGHFRQMYLSLPASYSFQFNEVAGQAGASLQWLRLFYQGCSPKDQFSAGVSLNLYYRKFYFGLNLSYAPRQYSDIAMIRNLKPVEAQMQLNYNITPNLYVAVALQGFAGTPQTTTLTTDGTFRSYTYSRTPEKGLRPWILIRWNMRRHRHRKINLDRVLQSTEEGIRLK